LPAPLCGAEREGHAKSSPKVQPLLDFLYPQGTPLDWVKHSLAQELPAADVAHVTVIAQKLIAIAERFSVPVETLVQWIHKAGPGRTVSGWRAWCAVYACERELAERGDGC
jgi:hypothetical protein